MIVLLAPIFNQEILDRYPATSPAMPLWSSYFAKYLSAHIDICCFYYVQSPMFPKGTLFVSGHHYNKPVPTRMVPYISIPYIRSFTRRINIQNEINSLVKNQRVTHIITINTSPTNIKIAEKFHKQGIKWVSIYADADTDEQLISNADFHIYFSYDAYIRSSYKNKMNFEGAVYRKVNSTYKENNNKTFLYSGVIRKENGVDLMIDAFKILEDKDATLKICGIGNYVGFIEKVKSDSRIIYYGSVDNKTLNLLYEEATFFINPRLSSYEENNNNFPSKLLDYLSYAKPIITTHTKGVNPIYLDYMFVVKNENPDGLAHTMRQLLFLSPLEKKELFKKIKVFANETYSWSNRVEKLWSWLSR